MLIEDLRLDQRVSLDVDGHHVAFSLADGSTKVSMLSLGTIFVFIL